MTSPKLLAIQRQLKLRPEKAQAPAADDLASVIKTEIKQAVEAALASRQESAQQSPRLRVLLRSMSPPSLEPVRASVAQPAPIAGISPPTVQLQRDSQGRACIVNVGKQQYRVQRDVEGKAVALVPVEQAPSN